MALISLEAVTALWLVSGRWSVIDGNEVLEDGGGEVEGEGEEEEERRGYMCVAEAFRFLEGIVSRVKDGMALL